MSAFVSLYYIEPVSSPPPSVPEMEGIYTTGQHPFFEDVPLMELIYLVFTRMLRESNSRRLRSLLLYLWDIFRALIHSLVCWLCTSALGLVLFQIRSIYCLFFSPPVDVMCVDVFRLYANFDIKFCFLDVLLGLELDELLWQRPTSGTNTNGTVFFFFSRRLSRTNRSTYWLPWDRFSNILHWWDSSSSWLYCGNPSSLDSLVLASAYWWRAIGSASRCPPVPRRKVVRVIDSCPCYISEPFSSVLFSNYQLEYYFG